MGDLTATSIITLKNVEARDVAKYISAKDTDYKSGKKELPFTVSSSPKEQCFRLVHDGKTVYLYEENDCVTETGLKMVCVKEEAEMIEIIKSLGLTLPEKKDIDDQSAANVIKINKIVGA